MARCRAYSDCPRAFKGRNGVGEALAARGPSCENGVLTVSNGLDRGGLVVIELLDSVVSEDTLKARVDIDILEGSGPAGALLVELHLSIVIRPVPKPRDGVVHRISTQSARLTVPIPVPYASSCGWFRIDPRPEMLGCTRRC